MKTFSIITPVYNGTKYITKCIEAVANCDYDLKNIEHIIVDDGSTDDTKQICETFARAYKHIKFYSKPNGNWGSVINYVKHNKLAHNDYVVVCDADDIILSGAFKTVNEDCNDADYCAGSFYLWDGGKKKRKVHPYYFAFKRNMVKKSTMHYYTPLLLPHCSYLKKELFYQTSDLKEKVSYQDNIFYLDAFRKTRTITYIPKGISLYWQKREGNTMSDIKNNKGLEMQIDNLRYYSQNNIIEPFFYIVLGMKFIRKYIKKNNIKFMFSSRKLNLTGFPFYVRPILRLIFWLVVSRTIKKVK